MRGSTSISDLLRAPRLAFALALALAAASAARTASAEGDGRDKVLQPEEDDFSSTPFTDYGEFNEAKEEEQDTKFFQQGRFFGISLGLGVQAVAGNRGLLWQGGFPVVDFRLHYWFDFNVALDLGITTAQHFYFTGSGASAKRFDVNLFSGVIDAKYYFDTKDLAAPISFANPYLLGGVEAISKTERSSTGTTDPDASIGVTGGAGLEFAVTPRKLYFSIEAKAHYAVFRDTSTSITSLGITDLTGPWFTFTGNVLITW